MRALSSKIRDCDGLVTSILKPLPSLRSSQENFFVIRLLDNLVAVSRKLKQQQQQRQKTMNEEEEIDFRKLEKELSLAVEADAKYDRENSAKFRAVEQRVSSYEEFKDIVCAAHLKPLDRRDITGKLQ